MKRAKYQNNGSDHCIICPGGSTCYRGMGRVMPQGCGGGHMPGASGKNRWNTCPAQPLQYVIIRCNKDGARARARARDRDRDRDSDSDTAKVMASHHNHHSQGHGAIRGQG